MGGGAGRVSLGVCITVYSMYSDMIAAHFKYNSPMCVRVCVCGSVRYLNPPSKL